MFTGGRVVADPSVVLVIHRALAHGHVCAVQGSCSQLGLRSILHRRFQPRDGTSVVARDRRLQPRAILGLGPVSRNEMFVVLDWLPDRRPWIEQSLANRFTIIAQPTLRQAEAFQRFGVEPSKMIPVPLHP